MTGRQRYPCASVHFHPPPMATLYIPTRPIVYLVKSVTNTNANAKKNVTGTIRWNMECRVCIRTTSAPPCRLIVPHVRGRNNFPDDRCPMDPEKNAYWELI